jgi:hypothetical protein
MVIKELLRELKQTPMDLAVLKKLLPSFATTKNYDELKAHRSHVFKDHIAIVLLIPSTFSDIGHFVVLLKRPKAIEYFSSLGGSPYSELEKLGQNKEVLMKLLGPNFIYNSRKLQSRSTTIHDCALWCLARCHLHEMKLAEFQKLFQRSLHLNTPDDIVACMTVLLVSDKA